MTIDLYYMPASSPCRAVMLTASAAGVQLNLKFLDLLKGEQMAQQFLKVFGLINLVNPNYIFC
jgi:glutathione S-transferase